MVAAVENLLVPKMKKVLKQPAPVADHSLIEGTKTPSMEEIHRAFQGALMGFFLKRVKNKDLAEDFLQETLLKTHLNLNSVKNSQNIPAWIYQIARNVITDHFRKKRPLYESDTFESSKIDSEDPVISPDFLAMSGCVEGMVKTLPAKYREALMACDLSQYSQHEASKQLEISLPALKSRLLRGRQALKKIMRECCKDSVSQNCQSKISSSSCGCQEFHGTIS
jgi:RNA polymerase sigma-70 factor (ECF subfamily)